MNPICSKYPDVKTIELVEKLDWIDPPYVREWSCNVEMKDGTWKEGYVLVVYPDEIVVETLDFD